MTPDSTYYHEAAHAVVGSALGLRVDQVAPDAEDAVESTAGYVLPADYKPGANHALDEALIVGALAGVLAEERLAEKFVVGGSRVEIEDALQLAASVTNGRDVSPLVRKCQAKSRRLVEENWSAIEEGARWLAEAARAQMRARAVIRPDGSIVAF